jgi:hypothetical protein
MVAPNTGVAERIFPERTIDYEPARAPLSHEKGTPSVSVAAFCRELSLDVV